MTIKASPTNPFILKDNSGEEAPSTKVWIDHIPISFADSEIEFMFIKLGCELRSSVKMERARDADHKLTRFLTGRRLDWSYSQHEDISTQKPHKHVLPKSKLEASRRSLETKVRWRRAVKDQVTTVASPLGNNTTSRQIGTTEGCGVTKTCIRYGYSGCGHLTCDYMLSYHVINSTEVHMELSAIGTGWVAVGFSSDIFMGGDDDVMGCKRGGQLTDTVVSMSLGNAAKHSPPQVKQNRVVLLDGLLQDDRIYCHVKRPLKYPKKMWNSDLDLVNDWHQLYAHGDIDGAGRILQHTQEPRVSARKITMLRVTDIMIASAASLPLPLNAGCLLSLLLPLTLAFFAGS